VSPLRPRSSRPEATAARREPLLSHPGMMMARLLGAAGVLGGMAHAGKGAVLLLTGRDLSLVPVMLVLFALGMLALYKLVATPGALARAGLGCTVAAVAAGVLAVGCQVLGWQPEDPRDPVIADLAYGTGTIAILLGLLLLGVALHRECRLPAGWRSVPLLAAVVWFPLEGLTAVWPDGWGLLLAGLAWAAAAAVVFVSAQGAASEAVCG
jgi:hypothetical protein